MRQYSPPLMSTPLAIRSDDSYTSFTFLEIVLCCFDYTEQLNSYDPANHKPVYIGVFGYKASKFSILVSGINLHLTHAISKMTILANI